VVARWLEDNRPASFTPGLMHGDHSPFNVMASYQRTDRLAAIIDWDTAPSVIPCSTSATMMANVIDTSLQIHGALGYTLDTPLASWYAEARMQRLVDGPDEIHRWTVGRNVVKTYQRYGSTALAAGGDLF
jgi:aminoglycoside phosphotransferase (APT) family kinase protein